ncbi:MAG TPA: cytochrome P450 [Thermoanaerobaculia bacterium]
MNSESPPGPPGRLLLGNLPDFARDVLGFLTFCAREYGDVTRMRLGRYDAYLFNHPDLVDEVLRKQRENFIKHRFFWRHVTAIFGTGLLTSEGDFWLHQRRLAAPAFHPDRIANYGDVMVSYTDRLVDGWRDGETRNVHEDMMRVTMEIVSKTLFDADVETDVDELGRAFEIVLREIAARFRRPFKIPDWIPTPGNLRYGRGIRRLERLVFRILAERRADPHDRGDLLSMLMSARDDEGNAMSDSQLRDELVTIFLAGHETTAIALSWTWHLLAQHPLVKDRLVKELFDQLGRRPATVHDLPNLPFADAVVKEAIRLYPPAYVLGREALADCEIGGWRIPAGATVFVSPWVMHRDRRWFASPEKFLPERWLDGLGARLPRFAYIPFGGGPRVCIGDRFATMEAVLILATVARRDRLERTSAAEIGPFPSITLRPEGGVRMKLSRRQPMTTGTAQAAEDDLRETPGAGSA